MLDDEVGRPDIAGEFWDDADLNRQLNSSQLILLQSFADNGVYHLMQGLLSSMSQVCTSDLETVTLPTDYFLAVSVTVDNLPARLHMGGVGVVFEQYGHHGGMIEGDNVVFKGMTNLVGTLWYIRLPLGFEVNPVTDRTEFDDAVYQCILYHAASTLEIKDDGSNSRYEKYYKDALSQLLQEPPSMLPMFDDNLVP